METNIFKRKEGIRKENKIIYIFSEGVRTEKIYFESKKREIDAEIRRRGVKIEIKGVGYNTVSLVDFVLDYINANDIDLNLDDCWVVFDKDDFDRNFDSAIDKASSNGIKVAYSNEAFELWLLLHFSFMNSALGRNDYNGKLTDNFRRLTGNKGYKYQKNSDVYPLIRNKESVAIQNAKTLLKQYDKMVSCLEMNPSTTVHLLVEDMNKLKN